MKEAEPKLEGLLQDEAEIRIYIDRKLVTRRIKDLAEEAIEKAKILDARSWIRDPRYWVLDT